MPTPPTFAPCPPFRRLPGLSALAPILTLLCLTATQPGAHAQLVVGTPTVDSNGVQYYPVTSVYQGSQQQIVRVLKPTNPAPGKPLRILYVLPVDQGVDTTDSTWSDGLEELRLLDVQDRFNMILIAPAFNYTPWYGDNITDPALRMESFIIDDLVPWGDTFLKGATTQRYLIGFSKSGNGVLFLMFRHPSAFNAGAAWDSPAQQSSLSADPNVPENFGNQANYNHYFIPSLVASNAQDFQQKNRLWVSGDQAAWTADMDALNAQLTAASIPHTWVAGPQRAHSWNSGWLNGAVTDLDANNPTAIAPVGGNMAPARTGGLPGGPLAVGTVQTKLSLKTDLKATCRYSTTAGIAYSSMSNTFSTTGGTAHSTVVAGLQRGASYAYYVRCHDTASGIVNPDDYAISFSIESTAASCTPSNPSPNPNPNPNPESFAAVGDFDGDCKSDILWRNTTSGQVDIWLMNGTTIASTGGPGAVTSDWSIQGVGDFNGDGYADLLWRNSTTGEAYIWLMNGTTIASSGSLGYVSSDWSIAGVGDFDGDGNADILWQNSTTGQVYLWLMYGTTITGGGSISYVSSGWNIAGVGDFDGDGNADILWRNSSTGQIYVWLMNGATIASTGTPGSPTSDWSIAGVGDFDGNGTSDILWKNTTSGQIYIWFMNGTTYSSSASVSYISPGWSVEGVGDYDGSGRAGILWRNSSTEQVYIWQMNGATLTSSGSPGAPAAAWQIVTLAP